VLFVSDRSGVNKIWVSDPASGTVVRATAEPAAVAEGTPFVDAQNTLWLAWGGADAAGAIAVAAPAGATWGKATLVPGLGHVTGARDEAPRLLPDGLTLIFASTRAGGFFPGVSTIWAATRPTAASASWTAFPLPELGGVSGVSGPSIANDGCSIAVAETSRATSFRRDIAGSSRILP
jgi:Tol biopolymer transport system component